MKNNKKRFRIYLSPPYQSGNELQRLQEVLASNWLAPGGGHVEQFENRIKKITNRKYCVALNSGTAALHLALKALNIGHGDYVICQTFSYVATANPIAYLKAKPVFIDSEEDTLNMDPFLLEQPNAYMSECNTYRITATSDTLYQYTDCFGNSLKAAPITLGQVLEICSLSTPTLDNPESGTIEEIGFKMGYSDNHYFSRSLKRKSL